MCADCDVPLVNELPKNAEDDDVHEHAQREIGFAEVFITLNTAEVILVKSILDGAGIEYYIKSEHFTLGRPFEDPARLYIREDQIDEAMEILKDFDFGVLDDLDGEDQESTG